MHRATLLPAAALAITLGSLSPAFAQQQQPAATTATAPASAAMPQYRKLDDMPVVGSDGNKIGEVEEVLIDSTGRVAAVTVDVGGFLGVGDREVVMALEQFSFQGNRLVTGLSKAQLEALPAWNG